MDKDGGENLCEGTSAAVHHLVSLGLLPPNLNLLQYDFVVSYCKMILQDDSERVGTRWYCKCWKLEYGRMRARLNVCYMSATSFVGCCSTPAWCEEGGGRGGEAGEEPTAQWASLPWTAGTHLWIDSMTSIAQRYKTSVVLTDADLYKCIF